MECITECLGKAIVRLFHTVDLSPLPGKPRRKLVLTPEVVLAAIQGPSLT